MNPVHAHGRFPTLGNKQTQRWAWKDCLGRLLWVMSFSFFCSFPVSSGPSLLNVSYDSTRRMYNLLDKAFTAHWKALTGETIVVQSSHGGSGAQARAVIDGLNADVVTLALAADIDAIATQTKKIPPDWQGRLPENSTPCTSTIVFLVHKDNPKNIQDWDDLVKPGIKVVTPNPKTSGGARWNYLAAWAYALKSFEEDEAKTRDFMVALYKNVPVLDTSARTSTLTFVRRAIGDVLITWETDALLVLRGPEKARFKIIIPSVSILAEPPVTLVDGNVDKKGTRKYAEAYVRFLYSPQAQALMAKNYCRPRYPEYARQEDIGRFAPIEMATIDETFGGWVNAQAKHFKNGAIFDQITAPPTYPWP